jgi:hypothetical protein
MKATNFIAIASLLISSLTLVLTSPFIYNWYTKPKLIYSNPNIDFFSPEELGGRIAIKNIGKTNAKNVVVFLVLFDGNNLNGEDKGTQFISVKLTKRYQQENDNSYIESQLGRTYISIPIDDIPPNMTSFINYQCNKACSIPSPIIKYSEGDAIQVIEIDP